MFFWNSLVFSMIQWMLAIIYKNFKVINWPLCCNSLYYFISDGMLESKHFTKFVLLCLGHRIPSDLINMCLQGLLASNYELRRNSSIKSFSTKSEEVYSLRNLRYKCWTKTYQREKWILLDLMKQWCIYLHPGVLLLITDPVSRVSP